MNTSAPILFLALTETLAHLRPLVTCSQILPLYYFTASQWQEQNGHSGRHCRHGAWRQRDHS